MQIKRIHVPLLSALFAFFIPFAAIAELQEGVVLDPQTGNYTVTYREGYSGGLVQVIFVPATKIDPALKSKFHMLEHKGTVKYEYKLKSSSNSKQNIVMLLTTVSSINLDSLPELKDWEATAVPPPRGPGLLLSWAYRHPEGVRGLPPGSTLSGLAVESADLPGIAIIKIMGGRQSVTEWLGHSPVVETPVGKQVEELEANDHVPRPAAVPRIPVPSPFDAAVVLTSLQKHVKEDLVGMALIDPFLVSKLDPLFAAAIDAAQRGNAEGTRRAIKDIRHLLKREHEDVEGDDDKDEDDDQNDKKHKNKRLIDKLAAKVLDFDLKYVEKRVKGSLD